MEKGKSENCPYIIPFTTAAYRRGYSHIKTSFIMIKKYSVTDQNRNSLRSLTLIGDPETDSKLQRPDLVPDAYPW
jgi:hypothetical protein